MTTPLAAYPPRPLGRVWVPPISFQSRLADACRQVRDFKKGLGTVRIEKLATIASTCTDASDATALGDVFRGHSLSRFAGADLTVLEAMRVEAHADGQEDAAVVEYLANPCEANRLRAIEALRRAAETTLAVIDALHRRGKA